ncbi:MAG: HPr family phosphocarrier protein [Oscillospiraceae bacterium]|nr:HPr family phosphocarrier protein [Oscillospiraceae bacterium]
MVEKKIEFAYDEVIDGVKEFVKIVSEYSFDIDIISGRYVIDAKSIMGLFSLDLSSELTIAIHSDNCGALLERLDKFIIE